MIPTPNEAFELLKEYNHGEFHLKHGKTVGGVLRYFATELGYGADADFWETVGILHDLDFELYPEAHCRMTVSSTRWQITFPRKWQTN